MKINGWTLQLATVHGVRMWRHDSGAVEVKGIDGMNVGQIAQFIDWATACAAAGEVVPVPDWPMTDTDLTALLELDADTFLETADIPNN